MIKILLDTLTGPYVVKGDYLQFDGEQYILVIDKTIKRFHKSRVISIDEYLDSPKAEVESPKVESGTATLQKQAPRPFLTNKTPVAAMEESIRLFISGDPEPIELVMPVKNLTDDDQIIPELASEIFDNPIVEDLLNDHRISKFYRKGLDVQLVLTKRAPPTKMDQGDINNALSSLMGKVTMLKDPK